MAIKLYDSDTVKLIKIECPQCKVTLGYAKEEDLIISEEPQFKCKYCKTKFDICKTKK